MPTGEHCWKKNSGEQLTRTINLWIPSLTRSLLSYVGRYVEWDLNLYCTLLCIATIVYLNAEPRGRPVASSMYFFLKLKILPLMKLGELRGVFGKYVDKFDRMLINNTRQMKFGINKYQ